MIKADKETNDRIRIRAYGMISEVVRDHNLTDAQKLSYVTGVCEATDSVGGILNPINFDELVKDLRR